MNKFIKCSVAIVIVLACVLCVTACGDQQPELTGITAKLDDGYTVYLLDDLDTSKLTVTAKFSDDKEEVIQPSDYQISGFDNKKAGEQDVQIAYKGKTATIKINVSDMYKYKEEGVKPTFSSNGKRECWKVKDLKTSKYKYFVDETLQNELTEDEMVIPKYVAQSAAITKEPTFQNEGIVTITTTTSDNFKVYIPELDQSNVWGYQKLSNTSWTEDGVAKYKLSIDDLKYEWWGNYNYELKSDEYKISSNNQVDAVRGVLESLEITTTTKAPAISTKFVIEKVGTTKLEGQDTSRVVVTGKLLYGRLDKSVPPDYYSIYFKGEKVPFAEMFDFYSMEVLNKETKEYKIVTKFYTASQNVPLGTEGIHCSADKTGPLNGLIVKPGDEIVSEERKKFNIEISSLNAGQEIAVGDILSIGKLPCKILNIKDVTNNAELQKVTSPIEARIYAEVEIMHSLGIDTYVVDYKAIRTGQIIDIWTYDGESFTNLDSKIATAKITSVISKVKADIEVSGANEIAEGDTIENLVPGDMIVDNLTNLDNINKIGIANVISVPNAKNGENIYKDVVLEIDTTSLSSNIPQKDENYFSRECVDFLNGCLSVGETIKVYNADKTVALTITITAYNFD